MSAKENFSSRGLRGRIIVFSFLGFALLLLTPKFVRADSLEDAARTLARRVAASIRGASVTCELRNLSSLEGTEFASVSAAFQDELQRRGVRTAVSDATVALSVSVTQSPTEYIGVVQIQRKENPDTMVEALGPVKGLTESAPAFNLELHRELLFTQDSPVLDVMFSSNATRTDALGVGEISAYELREGHWASKGVERLPVHQEPRRSGRGFLSAGADSETVYLPGESCTIVFANSKGWDCEKNNIEVPVRPVTQESMAGKKMGAWFSAAQFQAEGKTSLVVTGQDGLARLFGDGRDSIAIFPGWGGEIASIHSGCGSGWQLLVTGAADWTKTDAVQIMEIKERRATAVSAPMEFPGAILALHTPGMAGAADATAATNSEAVAVVRNLQTGQYEAYLLTITCAH